jgi:TonB-dependent SusC/RagA subfamily outer membrane receptor
MKARILIAGIVLLAGSLSAQQRVVTGIVTAFNNLPIANVEVVSDGTGARILTDSLGQFSIVCETKDIIRVKSKTFQEARKRVKAKTESVHFKLEMEPTPENLQLAVGYGYISQSKLTHAASQINRSQFDFCTYNNIYDLIKGRCPGVTVTSNAGGPGAEQNIQIRGQSSINLSTTPLFVIDGMVTSSISNIAPCDVKSINFLKDSSASIYGSRGANGVIIIETMRGR